LIILYLEKSTSYGAPHYAVFSSLHLSLVQILTVFRRTSI
jgi:hypothetical protein